MNKSSKDLRQVFLRMNKAGSSAVSIAKVIGKTRQTVYNWRNTEEQKLLSNPNKSTYVEPDFIPKLKQYFENNPFDFNKEIGTKFDLGKSSIHRWRHKLGFKRKKAKTTYREADSDLKKTSKPT